MDEFFKDPGFLEALGAVPNLEKVWEKTHGGTSLSKRMHYFGIKLDKCVAKAMVKGVEENGPFQDVSSGPGQVLLGKDDARTIGAGVKQASQIYGEKNIKDLLSQNPTIQIELGKEKMRIAVSHVAKKALKDEVKKHGLSNLSSLAKTLPLVHPIGICRDPFG
jgi:hypothetical protein